METTGEFDGGTRYGRRWRGVVRAAWVFPYRTPPIAGGIAEIDGGILRSMRPYGGETVDLDLGHSALIPPLVNAHTHLDLTAAEGVLPPDRDFVAWIGTVIRFRISQAPEQTDGAMRDGYRQICESGAALVADISTRGYPFDIGNGDPPIFPFVEVLGLSPLRREAQWAAFLQRQEHVPPVGRIGVSPHAPYSTSRALYEAVGSAGVAVTTHLGEFREEAELLTNRSGPFKDLLEGLGIWLPDELAPNWDWILGTIPKGSLIAHANYLPVEPLKRGGHSVVYCPRTHAAFGHAPHPFRDFLDAGINVCLGTDSLASNPDLDVFAEAAFVHRRCPDFSGERLLEMATVNGAWALGKTGEEWLSAAADWSIIPLPEADDETDPYRLLFRAECGAGVVRRRLSDFLSATP